MQIAFCIERSAVIRSPKISQASSSESTGKTCSTNSAIDGQLVAAMTGTAFIGGKPADHRDGKLAVGHVREILIGGELAGAGEHQAERLLGRGARPDSLDRDRECLRTAVFGVGRALVCRRKVAGG